jgi:hypothetical protein
LEPAGRAAFTLPALQSKVLGYFNCVSDLFSIPRKLLRRFIVYPIGVLVERCIELLGERVEEVDECADGLVQRVVRVPQ